MGRAYFILFISCMVFISSYFLRVFSGVLAPDIAADLAISVTQVGVFSSATMLAYGLMQLPSGILADAIGPKKTIVFLSTLAGFCTLLFAFSSNMDVMIGARFATGIGLAVTVPLMAMLARTFPREMYARATSVLFASAGLGGVIAATPLVALSSAITWRYALAIFGVISLLMALFTIIAVPNMNPNTGDGVKKEISLKKILMGIFEVLTTKSFWPVTIWLMTCSGTYFGLMSFWWSPYFIQGYGFSTEDLGIILLIVAGTSIVLPMIGASLSDLVFKARKKPLFIFTSIGLIGTIVMTLSTGKVSLPIVIAQVLFIQAGLGCAAPLVFSMIKETFPMRLMGTATGCMNMSYPIWSAFMLFLLPKLLNSKLPEGIAAVDIPLAVYADAHTFAYYLVVANMLVAFAMCFLMKETFIASVADVSKDIDVLKDAGIVDVPNIPRAQT